MKTKNNSGKKKLPKGFKIDESLKDKYINDPFLIEKARKAEELIKRVGIPNF